MTVRCAKCGEELLGAVNRCWKCGQQFIARPTLEGLPPVQQESAASQPAVEAIVLDERAPPSERGLEQLDGEWMTAAAMVSPNAATSLPSNPLVTPRRPAIGPKVKRPANLAALGGTVGALVLGVFALALAPFRYEAAFIAAIGLVMGIWGLHSPRRGWALIGMLLCCLGISLGSFTGVRMLYLDLSRNSPVVESEGNLLGPP